MLCNAKKIFFNDKLMNHYLNIYLFLPLKYFSLVERVVDDYYIAASPIK